MKNEINLVQLVAIVCMGIPAHFFWGFLIFGRKNLPSSMGEIV